MTASALDAIVETAGNLNVHRRTGTILRAGAEMATADMRLSYQAAARYSTAYYGQLARSKLGLDRIELRAPAPVLASVAAPPMDERVRRAEPGSDACTDAPTQLCDDGIVQRHLGGHGCNLLMIGKYGASMAAWRSLWPLGYAWAYAVARAA